MFFGGAPKSLPRTIVRPLTLEYPQSPSYTSVVRMSCPPSVVRLVILCPVSGGVFLPCVMQRNYCWIRRNSKAALLYVSLATPAQSAHPQFGRCQATPGKPPKYEVPPVLLGEKKSVPDRSLATVFYEAHMSKTVNGGRGRGGLIIGGLQEEPPTLFTANDHTFRTATVGTPP